MGKCAALLKERKSNVPAEASCANTSPSYSGQKLKLCASPLCFPSDQLLSRTVSSNVQPGRPTALTGRKEIATHPARLIALR